MFKIRYSDPCIFFNGQKIKFYKKKINNDNDGFCERTPFLTVIKNNGKEIPKTQKKKQN